MRALRIAFLLVLTATPISAAAQTQKVDLRKMTCKEAIALPEATLDLVSVWIDGFMSDNDDPESMVVDFSGTDADEIKAVCQNNPGTRLLQAVEDLEDQNGDDD